MDAGGAHKKKTFSPVLARARFFYQSKRVMILNKRILADLSFHSIFVWNVPSKNTKKQVVRSHFKRGLFYQYKADTARGPVVSKFVGFFLLKASAATVQLTYNEPAEFKAQCNARISWRD